MGAGVRFMKDLPVVVRDLSGFVKGGSCSVCNADILVPCFWFGRGVFPELRMCSCSGVGIPRTIVLVDAHPTQLVLEGFPLPLPLRGG